MTYSPVDNKTLDLKHTKNIIFDLGNVIINLDIAATDIAFRELFKERYDSTMERLNKMDCFNRYEKGEIDTNTFVENILRSAELKVSKASILSAWNAMLLDIPNRRFHILQEVKKQYRTFCLSNTNDAHIGFINKMLLTTYGIPNLNAYFERVYLSHEMGMRKPDVEIFEKVIQDNQLVPQETLFIDDTKGHLEGAQKTGLTTFHMSEQHTLEDLFSY